MSRRRTKLEIIRDILLEAFEESTKTRILHRANMNVKDFPKYLRVLVGRNYIESLKSPQGSTLFRTTEKGRDLLKKTHEIQEIIEETRKK